MNSKHFDSPCYFLLGGGKFRTHKPPLPLNFINITMFPFVNSINSQYLSDIYASSAYYPHPYFFLSDDQQPSWAPLQTEEKAMPAILAFLAAPSEGDKHQAPTRASHKTGKTREMQARESSVSLEGLDESEEVSQEVQLRQKYGRNINSNIFLHMLKKISIDEEYQKIMVKMIAKASIEIEIGQFRQLLSKKISRLPSYISLPKMHNAFKGLGPNTRASEQSKNKEREFCRLLRILCWHYINNVHVLHIFNGLRIQKKSRRYHLAGCRKIAQLLK